MKKKRYIKPSTDCCQIATSESIADDIIISTSNASSVGGGELNAKGGSGFSWDDDDDNPADNPIYFNSLWDDE